MKNLQPVVRQSGMALLAMLILSAILMLVMTGIFYRHQLDLAQVHRIYTGEQAALLALSGESWATRILRDDARNTDIDTLQEDWAQSIPPLPVEGGILTGCLIDLQGRFNINNLSTYTPERWEQELGNISSSNLDTYLNILALQELNSEDARAAVVIDWMDADSDLIAGFSAEDPEYQAMQPPRLAANQIMVSLDEVAGLAGYSAAELIKLRPYITALPTVTPININTAPPEVLAALIPFVDDWLIEEIVLNRPFEDVQAFYQFVAETSSYLSTAEVSNQLPSALVSTDTEFFALEAEIAIGGIRMRLHSDIQRTNTGDTRVLSRSFETIPAVELDEETAELMASPCAAQVVSS